MRLLAPALLVLASALAYGCTAEAQEAGAAVETPCHPKRFVDGWLKSEGYVLDGWGLMDGVLHELWLGPRGWAVTATDARQCARVLSLPDAPRERPGGRAG